MSLSVRTRTSSAVCCNFEFEIANSNWLKKKEQAKGRWREVQTVGTKVYLGVSWSARDPLPHLCQIIVLCP